MYYWTQSFGLNTTHKADFHLTAPHSLPYSPTPKNQGAAICLLPTNPCLLPSCPLFLSPLVPKPLLCNKHHWLRMELSPDNVTWDLKAGLYHQNGWMSHNLIITEKHQSSDLTWYHIFFHLWSGRDSCLYSSGYVGAQIVITHRKKEMSPDFNTLISECQRLGATVFCNPTAQLRH